MPVACEKGLKRLFGSSCGPFPRLWAVKKLLWSVTESPSVVTQPVQGCDTGPAGYYAAPVECYAAPLGYNTALMGSYSEKHMFSLCFSRVKAEYVDFPWVFIGSGAEHLCFPRVWGVQEFESGESGC